MANARKLEYTYERFHNLFEGLDESVYVSDPDTYEILFANKKLRGKCNHAFLGEKCYKVLQNLDSPCPFCTNKYILGENLGKIHVWEFQNLRNKRWYKCIDQAVPWVGGKYVRFEMAIDVTERKMLEEEKRRFERRFSTLNKYAQNLSRAKTLGEMFKITLDAMEKTLGFEYASVCIMEGNTLSLTAYRGYSKPISLKLSMDKEVGITVKAAKLGKSILVPDVRKNKVYVKIEEDILSELAVPIKLGKKVLGVLNVESQRLAAFNEEDVKLMETLTSHAAIAISSYKRQEKLSALNAYGRSLNKANSIEEIAKLTLKAMEKALGYKFVDIFLIEGEKLRLIATRRLFRKREFNLPLDGRKGITVKVARTGKSIIVPDIRKERAYVGGSFRSLRSELAVPIKVDNKVLGVLNVEGDRIAAFDEEDKELLEILASHTAIALSNFRRQEQLKGLSKNLEKAKKELEAYANQLEQKVEERTRALKESQEQLLKAQRMAVIGELASIVGHDLRNPLTSISGVAHFLKKHLNSETNGKTMEMLELMDKNVAYSNKIINDLLDYSKEIKLDLAESNPKSIVEEALSAVKIPKNVHVINLTAKKPKIEADIEKLRRTFTNIIKNAIEAMPKGGTLTIKSRKAKDNIKFVFSDTGMGMSKKTLKNLWTTLFTTKARGMGFGLPICKRFVEAHGGYIDVKSTFRKGTTFTVKIPIMQKMEEGGEKIWVKKPESLLLTTTKT